MVREFLSQAEDFRISEIVQESCCTSGFRVASTHVLSTCLVIFRYHHSEPKSKFPRHLGKAIAGILQHTL